MPIHEGFLRLSQIIPDLIPIGKTSWWAGIKKGRFPKGLKLSRRITVWRASEIYEFIEKLERTSEEDAQKNNEPSPGAANVPKESNSSEE